MPKRIDFVVSRYSNVDAPQFVEAVNAEYYALCAGDYDLTPDIRFDAAIVWRRLSRLLSELPEIGNATIVDIGSGTGFVAQRLMEAGVPFRRYVGFEPSPHMRQIAADKIRDPRVAWVELGSPASGAAVIQAVACSEPHRIFTMNSVLHHVVWWERLLSDLRGIMQPGDRLVLCHEPNRLFWENPVLVGHFDEILRKKAQAARLRAYLSPPNYVRKAMRVLFGDGPVTPSNTQRINGRLRENSFITADLPDELVSAIVDYGVPLCWRNIGVPAESDEGFMDAATIVHRFFVGCSLECCFTYQHLGLSPEIIPGKYSKLEKELAQRYPDDGAQFCLVVRAE